MRTRSAAQQRPSPPGDGDVTSPRRGWLWPVLWVIVGAAALGVSMWVGVSRAVTLWHAHPAMLILVVVLGLIGVLCLIHGGVRARRGTPVRRRWPRTILRVLAIGVVVALTAVTAWLRPFAADQHAYEAPLPAGITVTSSATRIVVQPDEPTQTGLILHPGARVDPRAYEPLARAIAAEGYVVVIIKQPLQVGFLALGQATPVIADFPEIDHWAIGGHSLGGVAASWEVGQDSVTAQQLNGLLLWGSYPADTLSERTDLAVVSVFGERDLLCTPADIDQTSARLPAMTAFLEVPGATHAFFGDYGEQPGDGQPTTSRAAAQRMIIDASVGLLRSLGE